MELAAWRVRAGLIQREMAELAGYSRGAVASAETGKSLSAAFWAAADRALGAGVILAASHARTEAAVRAIRWRAWAARRDRAGMTAAVSDEDAVAVQDASCPHCGGEFTMTFLSGPAGWAVRGGCDGLKWPDCGGRLGGPLGHGHMNCSPSLPPSRKVNRSRSSRSWARVADELFQRGGQAGGVADQPVAEELQHLRQLDGVGRVFLTRR